MKKLLKIVAVLLSLGAMAQTVNNYSTSIEDQEDKLIELLTQKRHGNGDEKELRIEMIKYIQATGSNNDLRNRLNQYGERQEGPGSPGI